MSPLEVFTTLHARGVVLTPTCAYVDVPPGTEPSSWSLVFGLHVTAPRGVLSDGLRRALREHKTALVDLVEAYEERAAIAQYCGGLSRADAERQAWTALVEKGDQHGTHDTHDAAA